MANTFPIVTEVTLSELDALVAANGLNEGLQYKVTDKGWLVIATSDYQYIYIESIHYKKYTCLINRNTGILTVNILENTIGEIVWSFDEQEFSLMGTLLGAFPADKLFWFVAYDGSPLGWYGNSDSAPDSIWFSDQASLNFNLLIEIRVYF